MYLCYQSPLGLKIAFRKPALPLSSGLIDTDPDNRDGAALNVGVQAFIESAGSATTV